MIMIRLFVKHNKLYIILKLFVVLFLMLLLFLQNYNIFAVLGNNIDIASYLNNKDIVKYQIVPITSYDGQMEYYDVANEAYHYLKSVDDIELEYAYFQFGNVEDDTFVLMNKEYYINNYDHEFKSDTYPCILVPKTWNIRSGMYRDMPIMGNNEKYETDLFTANFDKATDVIILQDDIYVFGKGNNRYTMMFTRMIGGSFNINVPIESEDDIALAENRVNEVVYDVKKMLNDGGIDISFLINNISVSINNNRRFILSEIDVNMTRNISFILIFVAMVLIITKYFIMKNNDIIAIALMLGKNKFNIGISMFVMSLMVDVIDAIFLYYLIVNYLNMGIANPYTVSIILFLIVMLLDIMIIIYSLVRLDSKAMLMNLKASEAE